MRSVITKGLLFTGLLAGLATGTALAAQEDDWTIRAERIHTAAGDAIENGHVRVRDGKIASVGAGGGGGSGTLEAYACTPGMIELSIGIDLGHASVEQSTEATALPVADALDLFAYRWERVLKAGVTSALASPPDFDVLGGLSIFLKTGGEPTLAARTVKAEACLRGAIGAQPSSGNRPPRGSEPFNFYYRRPTTRMGVEWLFRKSYYDARQKDEKTPLSEAIDRTVSGSLPLIVKAMGTQDVRTAIYLKEEFGIPNMVVADAVEAWREPQLLRRSGIGVVLPPFDPSGRVNDPHATDSYFLPLSAPAKLEELGVPFALSAHDAGTEGARLSDQVGMALRGGLSFEAALAAVTIAPARMVGVDDRVGSIEVGKDADLLLWSGPPFEPTSRLIGVLLDGRLIVDPRAQKEAQ